MQIPAKTPVTLPAAEERVYDKLWITRLVAEFHNPNGDGSIKVEYSPYRILDDGVTKEFAPDGQRYANVENVFQLAAQDENVAVAITALLTAMAAYLD